MKPFFALLAVAATTLIAADALAQANSDAAESPDARANRREAQSYTSLVDHDSAFRARRMRAECDPIQSDDLRRQCIASFGASATNNSGSSDQSGMKRGTGRSLR